MRFLTWQYNVTSVLKAHFISFYIAKLSLVRLVQIQEIVWNPFPNSAHIGIIISSLSQATITPGPIWLARIETGHA